ncbi:MAG: glycosyltransferase family 2 protein [bacterium]|nr:glycosyltransferase family 2 protein [bacterium]
MPCFNEEEHICNLIKDIKKIVKDVMVVDDGSTDDTSQRALDGGAIVIKHVSNQGKGAALRTGFSYIERKRFSALITMDADRQHDYTELPKFIEEFKKNSADIVVGNRMSDTRNMPFVRLCTNRITSFFTSLFLSCRISDTQSGYRLIRTEVLKNINLLTSNFETESEVLIKAGRKGFRIKEIPIKTVYLPNARSKIRPLKDTLKFIRLILSSIFFR